MSRNVDLSFKDDPGSAFFVPGYDDGLYRLGSVRPFWKPIPGGHFKGLGISEQKRINSVWAQECPAGDMGVMFSQPIEFSSELAVARNLVIRRNCIEICGKWALTGPAGERLLGQSFRAWARSNLKSEWNKRLNEHFLDASKKYKQLPTWNNNIEYLDFVIEARNLNNFFHFKKELLCSICTLDELQNWKGRVKIVSDNPVPSAFALSWFKALFPELTDRVDFVQAPQTFERALIVWHSDFVFFQTGRNEIERFVAPDHPLRSSSLTSSLYKQLRFGGHSEALRLLREKAQKATKGINFDHLPRRFWVSRKPGESHDRSIANEDVIVSRLMRRGFEALYFEDLTPLEQIGVMQSAEVMVSYHGAGFSNMTYAAPGAQIVELGTLQTARIRLGDLFVSHMYPGLTTQWQ